MHTVKSMLRVILDPLIIGKRKKIGFEKLNITRVCMELISHVDQGYEQ